MLLDVIDKYYPVVTFNNVPTRAAWLNSELFEFMTKRDNAFTTAKRTKLPADWAKAKKLRNKVVDLCNSAKNEHTKNNLRDNKHNPKKFWDELLHVWGKGKDKSKGKSIYLSGSTEDNDLPLEETANAFNEFFVNIAHRIHQNIDTLTHNEELELGTSQLNYARNHKAPIALKQFIFRDVTNAEVKQLVKSIQIYKSSGISGLTSNLFKICAKILVPQLKFLFNLCIRSRKFPKIWKNTIVTPLYKNGDMKNASNYRPIACIPLPGKLLEKCIHMQLYDFLESNHLLNEFQYGFCRGKNTSQAIFNYLDNIYQNINNSIDTIAVYVDFRKAFDTVSHQTLLNKLNQFNLSPNAITLLNNYLSDRTQQVFVNKHLSDPMTVTTGVPQGSTLGPLLFVMYMNDLPNVFNHSNTLLFADDTVIYHPITKDFDTSFDIMQNELKMLNLWCRKNLLEVNTGKTKVMYFSSKYLNSTNKPYKKLTLNNNDLEYVDIYKYLGLSIDSRLTLQQHLNNTLKTVSYRVLQLKRIRPSITHKIALQLYKCMILPIIDYADIFYHNKNSGLLKKFQTIQNRCIRIISELPRLTNTENEEIRLDLTPLNLRRAIHIIQFASDIAYKQPNLTTAQTGLDNSSVINRCLTRSQNPDRNQMIIFRPSRCLVEKSISYTLRRAWNALPTWVHQSADKKALASFLLANKQYLDF